MTAAALAHAGLADANLILGIWGLQPAAAAFGVARRAAIQALQLDPNLAEAHTSLAEVVKGYEWNWSLAERHYQHALSLQARLCDGAPVVCATSGQPAAVSSEAASHIEQARRADPISPAVNSFLPYRISGRTRARSSGGTKGNALRVWSRRHRWRTFISDALSLFSNRAERAVETLEHAVALGGRGGHLEGSIELRPSTRWRPCWCVEEFSWELTERARSCVYVSPVRSGHCLHRDRRPRLGALDHLEQA